MMNDSSLYYYYYDWNDTLISDDNVSLLTSNTSNANTEHEEESFLFPLLLLPLCIFGIITNIVAIVTFARKPNRNDFHKLLMLLATYDLLVST